MQMKIRKVTNSKVIIKIIGKMRSSTKGPRNRPRLPKKSAPECRDSPVRTLPKRETTMRRVKNAACSVDKEQLSVGVRGDGVLVEVAALVEKTLDLLGEVGVLSSPAGEHTTRIPMELAGDVDENREVIADK